MSIRAVEDRHGEASLRALIEAFCASTGEDPEKVPAMLDSAMDAALDPSKVVFVDTDVVGDPRGYVVAMRVDNFGEPIVFVEQLYAERVGQGRALFERVCRWAREQGITEVHATVFHRERALARAMRVDIRGYYVVRDV